MKKLFILLAVFAALTVAPCQAKPTATLAISPAIISNTYTGVITLQIGSIPNGDEMQVDKYIDFNGSGVLQTNNLLVDAFKITDNGTFGIYGSVTNVNVPVDVNPASGTITTILSVSPLLPLENMVGHYIYRVSSPNKDFSPATNTLVVTNASTGQAVSGVIYSNGLAPQPYALMLVQTGTSSGNGNYVGAAVTDANGNYQFNLVPGTYSLMPILPGYFADTSVMPAVTLTNGQSATNNLYLTNGPATISGTVLGCTAATTNTLGGVLLKLTSGNLLAIAVTDTNGNYIAGVSSNNWTIKLNGERLARRQYVVPTASVQANTTTGSVAGVNNHAYAGTGLFYGQVLDNSNHPFANLEFDGSEANGLYNAKGFSDVNGNYAVAVLTFLPGDAWGATPSTSANAALTNYLFNTDAAGDYSLAAAAGNWAVQFLSSATNNSLQSLNLIDLNSPHLAAIPPANVTLNLTLYTNTTPYIDSESWLAPSQFSFAIHGAANVNYTVQVSTNLATTNWINLQSLQLTNPYPFYILDEQATNGSLFYRVRQNY